MMVLSNKKFILEDELSDYKCNPIGYLYREEDTSSFVKDEKININNDIVIKEKSYIKVKFPHLRDNKRSVLTVLLKKNTFIVNYYDDEFISFLERKMNIYTEVNRDILFLLMLEYYSFIYTERLLEIEDQINMLFDNSVEKGVIDNKEILNIKKQVSLIKRYIVYYKSMLNYLGDELTEEELLSKVFLVIDNTINLVENVEASIYSCIDIYNSVISNNMNKTMQLLTVITVMAIPITVITGIFGMNFEFIPLLNNPLGFYLAMGIGGAIIISIWLYFKRKKFI